MFHNFVICASPFPPVFGLFFALPPFFCRRCWLTFAIVCATDGKDAAPRPPESTPTPNVQKKGEKPTNFILLDMIKSKKFFPGPGWVASNAGGMDMERVNSLWRTITFPEDTTLHDIDNIFFCRDGATARKSRYFHDSQDPDRTGNFFSGNAPADFVRLPP